MVLPVTYWTYCPIAFVGLGYGPSDKQINRAEPPEKDEGLVMEGTTLRSTLSSLDQSLASRSAWDFEDFEVAKQTLVISVDYPD